MMAKGIRGGRFATLFVVLALLISLVPTPAYAATSKTVKNVSYSASLKTIKKKATKVKRGTTKLTLTKGKGWVKFTAPKKGTYTFTVSDLTTKDIYDCGSFYIEKQYGSYQFTMPMKAKTQGGKETTLKFATKSDTSGKKSERYLKSRYGKVKLNKGQTVYIYISTTATKKPSLKLNIK